MVTCIKKESFCALYKHHILYLVVVTLCCVPFSILKVEIVCASSQNQELAIKIGLTTYGLMLEKKDGYGCLLVLCVTFRPCFAFLALHLVAPQMTKPPDEKNTKQSKNEFRCVTTDWPGRGHCSLSRSKPL